MDRKLYINLDELSITDLFNRIRELEPLVGVGIEKATKSKWDPWLDKNPEYQEDYNPGDDIDGGGIKYSSICTLYDQLDKTVKNLASTGDPGGEKSRHLRWYVRKAEKYLTALYAYKPELYKEGKITLEYSTSKTSSKLENSEVIEEPKIVENVGKQSSTKAKEVTESSSVEAESKDDRCLVWYVYFLHFVKKGQKKIKPKIARTVLRAYNSNKAVLENLEDSVSQNYTGEWERIARSSVFIFNLWNSKKEEKEKRHLHFKVEYHDGDKILFGSYTTYDTKAVYSGSLLFERISRERLLSEDIKPLAISYDENPEDFAKIDESIIEYLSLAKDNYLFTPEPLGNMELLIDWVADLDPFLSPERRFFDYPVPRLFIACPQTSLSGESNEEQGEKLAEDLEKEFGSSLEVQLKKQKKPDNEHSSYNNMKFLQRTKYFILILSEINQGSFSLIQLGWALAHCKHIFVFYKPKTVSSRILDSENLGIKKYQLKDGEEGYAEMKEKIVGFIKTERKGPSK